MRSLPALLTAAVLLAAVPATAKVWVDRAGSATNATTKMDFLRHEDDAKYYTESWTSIWQTRQGAVLYINFMYTNIGVTEGRSAVSVNYTPPGGETKRLGWEYDVDEFQEDFDAGQIRIGPNTLTLQGRTARMHIAEKDCQLDATLTGWTGGVKFHDGRIWLNEKRTEYVQSWFHIPRGDLSGRATLAGQAVDLSGDGYLDHMAQNELSPSYSTHWWTTRYYAPDHTVAFWSFKLNRKRGGDVVTRLLVTDRRKVLFLTDQVTLKPGQTVRDPKAGHTYATKYEVAVQRGDVKLEGAFQGGPLHDRDAAVERLPWAQRNIAKMVAGNPVIFRMVGQADLSLTIGGKDAETAAADPTATAVAPVSLKGPALMEAIVNEGE